MKRILIAFTLVLLAGAGLAAMNHSAVRQTRDLQAGETLWQAQTQQLAEIQATTAALQEKVNDLKWDWQSLNSALTNGALGTSPNLANNNSQAAPESQAQLSKSLGGGQNSSPSYVLVSKAALADSHVRPLKSFPKNNELSDDLKGILTITPDEQKAVEAAFTQACAELAAWARENLQREGPSSNLVVQYSIPQDSAFREAFMKDLFDNISSIIGAERSALLRKYFEINGLYTDAAIADRTNILAIYRTTNAPGYSYRAGWRWADHSEAINTYPDPITPKKFPLAFRFVFPGGWPEVAQHEGFELPEEFKP